MVDAVASPLACGGGGFERSEKPGEGKDSHSVTRRIKPFQALGQAALERSDLDEETFF